MMRLNDEQQALVDRLDDDLWVDRQRAVERELTFTLNLLDQVEDETRQWYVKMLKRRESANLYDTRAHYPSLNEMLQRYGRVGGGPASED